MHYAHRAKRDSDASRRPGGASVDRVPGRAEDEPGKTGLRRTGMVQLLDAAETLRSFSRGATHHISLAPSKGCTGRDLGMTICFFTPQRQAARHIPARVA